MTIASKKQRSETNGYLAIAGALVLLLAAMGLVYFMGLEEQNQFLAEGAFVENLTVVVYGVCLVLIALFWPWSEIKRRWYFPALIVLFALRELDFDKAYFTVGLLKSRQYFGGLVPMPELLVSIMIVAFIAAVVISIIANEARDFPAGIKRGAASTVAVFAACGLVLSSKTLDGIARKLAAFDRQVSPTTEQFAFIFEEIAELGIPVMFAIAILFSTSSVLTGRATTDSKH